mgnify:CR=1 FL=1
MLLEERYFKLFWGAHTLSSLGTKMHQAALLWHIYTVSNSVIALGLIGLARLIPALLLILVGGFIADRGNRRAHHCLDRDRRDPIDALINGRRVDSGGNHPNGSHGLEDGSTRNRNLSP